MALGCSRLGHQPKVTKSPELQPLERRALRYNATRLVTILFAFVVIALLASLVMPVATLQPVTAPTEVGGMKPLIMHDG